MPVPFFSFKANGHRDPMVPFQLLVKHWEKPSCTTTVMHNANCFLAEVHRSPINSNIRIYEQLKKLVPINSTLGLRFFYTKPIRHTRHAVSLYKEDTKLLTSLIVTHSLSSHHSSKHPTSASDSDDIFKLIILQLKTIKLTLKSFRH